MNLRMKSKITVILTPYIPTANAKVDTGVSSNHFSVIKLTSLIEFDPAFCSIAADVDECASPDNNDCHSKALCTNTEGSYVCRCLRGYSGDGKNCSGKSLSLAGWNVKYSCT